MANFYKYFSSLIEHEGGYVDNPNDPGGATKFGITLATWRQQGKDITGDGKIDKADIKALKKEHALPVYKRAYWDSLSLDLVKSQSVAEIIFDHGVNAGVSRAGKMAQFVLQKYFLKPVVLDGKIGPQTLGYLNNIDAAKFFDRFKELRTAYYNYRTGKADRGLLDPVNIFIHRELGVTPSEKAVVFRKGWLNRVNSFRYIA